MGKRRSLAACALAVLLWVRNAVDILPLPSDGRADHRRGSRCDEAGGGPSSGPVRLVAPAHGGTDALESLAAGYPGHGRVDATLVALRGEAYSLADSETGLWPESLAASTGVRSLRMIAVDGGRDAAAGVAGDGGPWWLGLWDPPPGGSAVILRDPRSHDPSPLVALVAAGGASRDRLPPDVAGICDGAAGGHPSEGGDYLYPSIGPAGAFAPRADVWSDFLEWAACSGCVGADLDAPDRANATGRWSAPEHAWSGPFSRFMDQRGLYCLYAGRPGRCGPPHDVSSLRRYDLDRNVVETRERKFLVVTSAVGDKFRTVKDFVPFLSSLREHYDGPIKMLVGGELSRPVSDYLERHRVEIAATSEGRSWSDFNVYRFEYYSEACADGYDVCLAVDFGDVTFQSSPFPPALFRDGTADGTPPADRGTAPDLVLFAHDNNLHPQAPRGGRWFHKSVKECASFDGYRLPSGSDRLINAGGFYATPYAMGRLGTYVKDHSDCNDQVALNMAVHAGAASLGGSPGDGGDASSASAVGTGLMYSTEIHATYEVYLQGYGPVNNVGYKASYTVDSRGRVGGRDCHVSPVVHQADRLFQSIQMNPNCNLLNRTRLD